MKRRGNSGHGRLVVDQSSGFGELPEGAKQSGGKRRICGFDSGEPPVATVSRTLLFRYANLSKRAAKLGRDPMISDFAVSRKQLCDDLI